MRNTCPNVYAESLKRGMRDHYSMITMRQRGKLSFDQMVKDAKDFWSEYEEINRKLCPDDPVYSGTRAGVTQAASTADLWTLSVGSSGQLRILESFVGGESTSSAVCRLAMQRSTGGTTPTNQTPEKASTRSPSAVATFATTWSAQPTLSGNPFLFHAFNTFGGTDRWVPQPGEEIYLVNSEILSLRPQTATSNIYSAHVVWEEM